jgi:hypothetical protein
MLKTYLCSYDYFVQITFRAFVIILCKYYFVLFEKLNYRTWLIKRAAERTFCSCNHTHLVHVLDLACHSCKHFMQLPEATGPSFYVTHATPEGPIFGQHAVVHLRRILELVQNSSPGKGNCLLCACTMAQNTHFCNVSDIYDCKKFLHPSYTYLTAWYAVRAARNSGDILTRHVKI